jgi:hypothetical protein
MHYHCEIVIPPTELDGIEAAVESIMKPFYKGDENSVHSFWDLYVIGGRWAGTKMMAKYDAAKMKAFQQWMQDEKVTVSSLQCGKQDLSPASQISKVDAKWNEMFPHDSGPLPCPLFGHSNDQYGKDGKGTLPDDICTLAEANGVKCSRIIFAGPSYDGDTNEPLEATFMLTDEAWNGVNYMPVSWDGTLADAQKLFTDRLRNLGDSYREQMTPQGDWLAITVDYHS